MNHIHHNNLLAAAIGVTVGVISAASIFIYQKILEQQQQQQTVSNLDAANKKIAELQAELEAVRVQQSQKKKRRVILSRRHVSNDSTYATDNDTDVDAFSTADTDIGDDEFYDCSDSESAMGDNETRNSDAVSQLELVLKEIDDHVEDGFKVETYYKLQTLVQSQSGNIEVVWRFARACHHYSRFTTDVDIKKAVITEGIEACEKVLAVKDADLYKWYSILIGVNGDFLSVSDRIKNGYRFRDHVIMALELRPSDSELHHLLGRFKYEVASLTWIERKVAKSLFSEPPSASYEEALSSFTQAEEMTEKPFFENRLFICKCHVALNEYEKAIEWLDKALELPPEGSEDPKLRAEANKLLKKYSGYRLQQVIS